MTDASHIAIRDNPAKHRFEADLGEGDLAIAEYYLRPGEIVFTHTEVPTAHKGKGIGSAVVRFALNAARERELLVVPVCPFFGTYMKEHEEVQHLLAPQYRSKLGLG